MRERLCRWIDICIYGVVGALLFFAFIPLGAVFGDHTVWIRTFQYAPWILETMSFAGFLAALAFLEFVFRPSWNQLESFFLYPPLWLATVLAVAAAYVLDATHTVSLAGSGFSPSQWSYVFTWLLGAFLLWLCVKHAYLCATSAEQVPSASRPRSPGVNAPFELILEWAANEQPVDRPEDDSFGRTALAKRVVARLKSKFGRDETFAIVGAFGSGKSTIVHFVEEYLARDTSMPRVWLCNVSCWGFENSRAALHSVLASALRTLEEHVDCISVRGVPEAYIRVLSKGSGGWGVSMLQTAGPTRPEDQLRRLSKILRVLNARLVLSIEDVDRTKGSDFDPQHIQRMLYSLKSVDGVTFILSASTEGTEIDITKLCEQIESIPRLDRSQVGGYLRRLRKHGPELYDDVPTISGGRLMRNELGFPENSEEARISRSMGLASFGLVDALTLLVHTPREMKHFIRRVVSAWDRLHGEIDFDDLLLATALRLSAPDCFDFLVRNMDRLRDSGREQADPVGRQFSELGNKDNLTKAFEEAVARCDEPNATRIVLNHLGFRDFRLPTTVPPPQGIIRSDPVDYWRRMLAEEIAPTELHDQTVLRDTDQWLKRLAGPLIDRLTSGDDDADRYARVWEHFADKIDDDDLLKLAEEVVESLVDKHGAGEWPDRGLTAIWRRSNRRPKSTKNADWLSGLIIRMIPRSLAMSTYLYGYWGSVKHGVVDKPGREAVRRAMVDAAKGSYSDRGMLIAVLSKDKPRAIADLVRPDDALADPSTVFADAEDWRWLVPPMLNASKTAGHIALQIIFLIMDRVATSSEQAYVMDLDFAQRIFEDRLPEVMTLIVNCDTDLDPRLVAEASANAQAFVNDSLPPSP